MNITVPVDVSPEFLRYFCNDNNVNKVVETVIKQQLPYGFRFVSLTPLKNAYYNYRLCVEHR